MLLTIIYSIPAFVALAWALLFRLRHYNRVESQPIMMNILLIFGTSSLLYAQYFNPHIRNVFLVDMIFSVISIFAPSYYILYVKSLTTPKGVGLSKANLMIFPIAYSCVLLLLGVFLGTDDQSRYVDFILSPEGHFADINTSSILVVFSVLAHYFYCIYILLAVIVCSVYGIVKTKRYHELLNEYYSNKEKLGVSTMRHVLVVSNIALVIAAVIMMVPMEYQYTLIFALSVSLVIASIVFSVSFYSMRLNLTTAQLVDLIASSSDSQESVAQMPAVSDDLKESLATVMEYDMPFRDSDLNIESLAAKLNTNRTYLSRVINSSFGCSFSYYINNYRIEYAKGLMVDYPSKLLQEIATESGFNSMNSFVSHFVRVNGCKPSEWRKSRKNI